MKEFYWKEIYCVPMPRMKGKTCMAHRQDNGGIISNEYYCNTCNIEVIKYREVRIND